MYVCVANIKLAGLRRMVSESEDVGKEIERSLREAKAALKPKELKSETARQ